jgi:hypothetical protein
VANASRISLLSFGLLLAVIISVSSASHCHAADKKKSTKTAKPPTASPSAAPPLTSPTPTVTSSGTQSVVNSVTQNAVKGGVLACTSRINQVTNFLTMGSRGWGAFLFIPPTDQDQRLVSASLEIPGNGVPLAYGSASFAPNQANGCGGMYETVAYWPQACASVATGNFSAMKQISVLAKEIMVLDGGPMTKVFLMPAGTGCVSIKKEIVL